MSQKAPKERNFNGHSSILVGRSSDRILLQEQLAIAASGRGQLCIISGEAGIGKTALVRDMAKSARDRGALVLSGQSYDLRLNPPFGPWLEIASEYESATDTEERVPWLGEIAEIDPKSLTNQIQLFDQVRAFLRGVSIRQFTVLIFEDIHWADRASIELIRHIASCFDSLRVCIVLSYRSEDLTARNPLYQQLPVLIRESEGLRIDLQALSREDVEEIVVQMYSLNPDDRDRLVEFLVAQSEGNPFFAVEILRTLVNRGPHGGLWREGDEWYLADLKSPVVPVLVRQEIDLQLEKLGPVMRDPLATAAIFGQDIVIDVWQCLTGLNQTALLEIIDAAVEQNVLIPSADGTSIRFTHELAREVLYSSIVPPRRRLLHQKAAEALLQFPRVDPDAVAYHLQQSGDDRMVDWMIRAGEQTQRSYGWTTASERFSNAAEALADEPGKERLRSLLLYRAGRLLRHADAPQGMEKIQLAQRLAEAAGDATLAAEATYSYGLLQCLADKWNTGVRTMEVGITSIETMSSEDLQRNYSSINWFADALPAIEIPSERDSDSAAACMAAANVNYRRGVLPWFLAYSGRLDRAKAEAESFLSLVEQCGSGTLVLSAAGHALYGLGIAQSAVGEPTLARENLELARDMYRPLDHHALIIYSLLTELQEVVLRYEADNLVIRQQLVCEILAHLQHARGAFPQDLNMDGVHIPLMWIEGRWEEALAHVPAGNHFCNSMMRRPVANAITQINYHQGRSDAVMNYIRELLPNGPESDPGSAILPDALALQSLAFNIALDNEDRIQAERWLTSTDTWLEWSGSVAGQVEYHLDQARLKITNDHWDEARILADAAVSLSANPYQPLIRIAALRTRGRVEHHLGNSESAQAEFSSALALADACSAPYERALTLAEIATAGIDIGVDAVRGAREIGLRLGAKPLLAKLDSIAFSGDLNGTHGLALTTRERDVLKLVATGLTDAEIGKQLHISHRTVGQHLRSVYGKLQVNSRSAATRFALDHNLV